MHGWPPTYTERPRILPPSLFTPHLCRSSSPLDPQQLCLSTLDGCGVPDSLHLSPDQLLLAVACQDALHFYSVPDLASGPGARKAAPASSRPVPGIRCFAWAKAPGSETAFLVLTEQRKLFIGALGTPGLTQLSQQVEAADWSPSGPALVFSRGTDTLVFARADGSELSSVALSHPTGERAERAALKELEGGGGAEGWKEGRKGGGREERKNDSGPSTKGRGRRTGMGASPL